MDFHTTLILSLNPLSENQIFYSYFLSKFQATRLFRVCSSGKGKRVSAVHNNNLHF